MYNNSEIICIPLVAKGFIRFSLDNESDIYINVNNYLEDENCELLKNEDELKTYMYQYINHIIDTKVQRNKIILNALNEVFDTLLEKTFSIEPDDCLGAVSEGEIKYAPKHQWMFTDGYLKTYCNY